LSYTRIERSPNTTRRPGALRPVPGPDRTDGGLNSGGFATYIAGPINKERRWS